jgi:hypothetical protein
MPVIKDPNTNPIPGTAQVVAQSEAIRTIVEILRILVNQWANNTQGADEDQQAEQCLNLIQYLDTQMTVME